MSKAVAVSDGEHILAVYPSEGEAAKHFLHRGVLSQHISDACLEKRGEVSGYYCSFTDLAPFNSEYMIPDKKPILSIIGSNSSIEKEYIFHTFSEAGRFFQLKNPGTAATSIRRAIQRNGTWKGCSWKIIEGQVADTVIAGD